jgi:CRISPR-associated endonuclease/helicase Cas3
MTFYAHTNELDKAKWQSIYDHLTNTAELALKSGGDSGLERFAYIAAMLHDIGKYSQAFQRKLDGAHIRVDHSTAGAKEVIQLFTENQNQKLMAKILAFCIAGHHGGLPDHGSRIDLETDGTLSARIEKRKIEDYSSYTQEIDRSKLVLPETVPIKPNRKNIGFSLAFFTRMVYSCVVDADFLETETFMNKVVKPRGGYEGIESLCEKLNLFLDKFQNPEQPINQKRTDTLNACVQKAAEGQGFYTLTVPTGGGKTHTSLAFALNHAVAHDLKRIIYVIPFTSIIEQNAAVFKECLGSENVLEHHSNFDWEQKRKTIETADDDDRTNSAIGKLKLAAENWDIPIVVTTNVQFFESLFANRSSQCRKLHNIAKSVIIFDEAQMLPREYLKPCMNAVYELVTNYGATVIFCTATQPSLSKFLPEDVKLEELSPDPKGLFDFYKRVEVKNIGKLADDELVQRMNEQKQALCIVNTRKHAKGLFEGLANDGRFHLSTLMCPVHRKATIAAIRQRLKGGQPCRVVSTQIMEAGIDIDFSVGYRAIAGLDSIIQAAGRVNREGKAQSGYLYVFEPDSQFIKKVPAFIQQGADVARKILREYPDPVCTEAILAYYEQLYSLHGNKAYDSHGILDLFEKDPANVNFDFKTAAENFRLIEDNTKPVIIRYDEQADALLKQVSYSEFPASFQRKLQIYTTNIYEREFKVLERKGAIDIYADTYTVLNDMQYYNAETGLVIPEDEGGEAIFFD